MDNRKRIINPNTGRLIIVGGKTYKKVFNQKGGDGGGGVFNSLLDKAKDMNKSVIEAPMPTSKLPPAPDSTDHSWYHHHAPFAQTFGDYVCLKKSTLKELGSFLKSAI